jgi:DNA replication and repair protein RecF
LKLKKIELKNFRNIESLVLEPHSQVNIIYGDNAQGKTNIIEAIWLFSGLKSFRGVNFKNMIKFNEQRATMFIDFYSEQRDQTSKIIYSDKKEVFLNDVKLISESKLNSHFNCVVFSPIHLNIVKNSPDERRKFLNDAICQIKPSYKSYLNKFEKVLSQRNALLKNTIMNSQKDLDVWDMALSEIGTLISLYRQDYISKINEIAKKIYKGISNEKEQIDIKYVSNVFDDETDYKSKKSELVEIYYNKLKSETKKDILFGSTTIGASRDEIEITLDDISAKTYASQGQQRSCVIVLKLAEAYLLKLATNEFPIMLLDDVMSELDLKRQHFLIHYLKDFQVFITCCNRKKIKDLEIGKTFRVKNGAIK